MNKSQQVRLVTAPPQSSNNSSQPIPVPKAVKDPYSDSFVMKYFFKSYGQSPFGMFPYY